MTTGRRGGICRNWTRRHNHTKIPPDSNAIYCGSGQQLALPSAGPAGRRRVSSLLAVNGTDHVINPDTKPLVTAVSRHLGRTVGASFSHLDLALFIRVHSSFSPSHTVFAENSGIVTVEVADRAGRGSTEFHFKLEGHRAK